MKKRLLALCISILMIIPSFLSITSSAVHVGIGEKLTEVGDVPVAYLNGEAPAIDGDLSDWEGFLTTMTDSNFSAIQHYNNIPHYLDGEYRFGMKYDDGGVYIAMQITDFEYTPSTATDPTFGGNGDALGFNFDFRQNMRYDSKSNSTTRYYIYTTENTDGTLNFCMYRYCDYSDSVPAHVKHIYGQLAGSTYYVGDPNGIVGKVNKYEPRTYVDPNNGDTGIVNRGPELLDPEAVIDGAVKEEGSVISFEFTMPWDMILDDYDVELWYMYHFDDFTLSTAWENPVKDANGNTVYMKDPVTGQDFINSNGAKVPMQDWVAQTPDYSKAMLGTGESRMVNGKKQLVKNGFAIDYWDVNKLTHFNTAAEDYYMNAGTQPNANCGIYLVMDSPIHGSGTDISTLEEQFRKEVSDATYQEIRAKQIDYFFDMSIKQYEEAVENGDLEEDQIQECEDSIKSEFEKGKTKKAIDDEVAFRISNIITHVPGDWEVAIEPQIGVEGEKVRHCLICGEEYDRDVIPALVKHTADDKLEENYFVHLGNAILTAPFTFSDTPEEDDNAVISFDTICLDTGDDTLGIFNNSVYATSGITTKAEVPYTDASVKFMMGENFHFTGAGPEDKSEGAVSFAWISGIDNVDDASDIYITDARQIVYMNEAGLRSGRGQTGTLAAYTEKYRQSPIWPAEQGMNNAGATYLPGGATRSVVSAHGAGIIVTLYPSADLALGAEDFTAARYEISIVQKGAYKADYWVMGNLETPINLKEEVEIGLNFDDPDAPYVYVKNTDGEENKLIAKDLGDFTSWLNVKGPSGITGNGLISLSATSPQVGNANMKISEIAGQSIGTFGLSEEVLAIEEAIAALPHPSNYEEAILLAEDIAAIRAAMDESLEGEWISNAARHKLEAIEGLIEAGPYIPSFIDVTEDKWYYNEVIKAAKYGLFSGVGDGTRFDPNGETWRAMIVAVIHRAAGGAAPESATTPFTDVPANAWFALDVAWALENGVAKGTSATTFSPQTSVTREQIAVMLFNFAKSKGINTDDRADLSKYADANKISSWATDAISWATAVGMITGDGTNVNPKGTATRAEAAAIMVRFYEAFVN